MQVYRVKRIIIGLLAPAGARIIGVKSRSSLPAHPASQTGSHKARRGAVAARQAHNLEVSGSSPLAATPEEQRPLPPQGSLCFPPAPHSIRSRTYSRQPLCRRVGAGRVARVRSPPPWAGRPGCHPPAVHLRSIVKTVRNPSSRKRSSARRARVCLRSFPSSEDSATWPCSCGRRREPWRWFTTSPRRAS